MMYRMHGLTTSQNEYHPSESCVQKSSWVVFAVHGESREDHEQRAAEDKQKVGEGCHGIMPAVAWFIFPDEQVAGELILKGLTPPFGPPWPETSKTSIRVIPKQSPV